jgi:hypothetical protein
LIRTALPASRLGLALWAWRRRDDLADWGRFGVRAMQRLASGDSEDVVAEARLRSAAITDGVIRNATGLQIAVHDGVAVLGGQVTPEVASAVRTRAERTKGVHRIRDEMRIEGRRRGFMRRAA